MTKSVVRSKLAASLNVPPAQDLIQADGTVKLTSQNEWSELSAKINIVTSSASEKFMSSHSSEIQLIRGTQRLLADGLKTGLILALKAKIPNPDQALATVLCPGTFGQQDAANQSPDWTATIQVLQKLADSNPRLLLNVDTASVLGMEIHNELLDVLKSMTNIFGRTFAAVEWMILSFILIN